MRSLVVAVFLTAAFVAGCDTSVRAFDPPDSYHYTVFGILNLVRDTQWVRVEPIRPPTTEGAPRSLGVTVTLENLRTGQVWSLRDSVVEIHPGEPQHNYWTTAPVETATSYRLVVRGEDGDSTTATTETPDGPPNVGIEGAIKLPCVEYCPSANLFEITVSGVEELAALQVRYFQTVGQIVHFDYDYYDVATLRAGGYSVLVNYLEVLRAINPQRGSLCTVDSAHVITAGAGPGWPEWEQYHDASLDEVARPDTFTNVEGGLGMFSAVYTDTALVKTKRRREKPVGCEL